MTQEEVLEKSESYSDCAMAAHGHASYEDDQNNESHGGSDYSDPVHGPVIVDAEGRRRPLISYHPSQSTGGYAVTTVETVEHVRRPVVVAEYRYVSQGGMQPPRDYACTNPEYTDRNQGTVEPRKAYGYKIERQRSPPRLVGDHPEYKYPNNHGTDGPPKDYGSINETQHSRPSLVGKGPGYKYNSNNNHGRVEPPKVYGSTKERGPSPPRQVADRPQVDANDYTTPTKGVPLNSGVANSRWGRPSSGQVGNPPVTNSSTKMEPPRTYGSGSDNKWQPTSKASEDNQPKRPNILPASDWRKTIAHNKYNNEEDWNRPSGNTIRDGNNKDYYQRNDGWEESGNKGWTTAPTYITAFSATPSDIDKAREMLKEYAAQQPRYGLTPSTLPKGNTYTETIDNKETPRRYGDLKQSPEPFQEGYDYSRTIDSNKAARMYKGRRV